MLFSSLTVILIDVHKLKRLVVRSPIHDLTLHDHLVFDFGGICGNK